MQKTQIKNVVSQTTMSLSNRDIKNNVSHHHMYVTVGTHPSEDHQKIVSNPFFAKI